MIPFRLALLLALGLSASAHAVDAYSNLGSPARFVSSNVQAGYPLYRNSLNSVNQGYGFQFASTATGTLTGFQVAMNQSTANQNDPNRTFILGLYADSGSDTLGTRLGTYSGKSRGVDTMTSGVSPITVVNSSVRLVSGARYWVVATLPGGIPRQFLTWNRSTVSTPGRMLQIFYGEPVYQSGSPAGFSVQVKPSPVPEPASLGALGLGALGFVRRRRR